MSTCKQSSVESGQGEGDSLTLISRWLMGFDWFIKMLVYFDSSIFHRVGNKDLQRASLLREPGSSSERTEDEPCRQPGQC